MILQKSLILKKLKTIRSSGNEGVLKVTDVVSGEQFEVRINFIE